MEIVIPVLILLIVCSAFFSGSETALTTASRGLMLEMAREGDGRASQVLRLLNRRERMIGTILLGNNVVNIAASALATSLFTAYFGDTGVAYATLVMTIVVLVFGEILPKTYALTHANRLARAFAPIMLALSWLFGPITRVIEWLARIVLSTFGSNAERETDAIQAVAELRGAIDMHTRARRDGELLHERAMLKSVLDLADVEVAEIMIHRNSMEAIDSDLPAEDIVQRVLESPFTRIPLWKGSRDNVVGVLHARALFRALRDNGGRAEGLDIRKIAAPPWFIPDTTTLLDQLQAFRARREHFALVVDEYGVLRGIVTLEDILEEIVGDIADEHDRAVAGVVPQPDGSLLIEGRVTLRDLNRQYDWDLPDEDASTLAGLLLHETQRIPDIGTVYRIHGFRMEVLRKQRNQLTLIKVVPPRTGSSLGEG